MDVAETTNGATASEPVVPRRRRNRGISHAASATGGNGAVAADDLLSASDILGAQDALFEDVPCPEWKGIVRVRGLTGRERDDYEIALIQTTPGGGVKQRLSGAREKLVAKCAIDRSGNRLFTDEQAAQLGTKNGRVLDRLFDVAARLSGLRAEDVARLAKNSTAAPSDDSAST